MKALRSALRPWREQPALAIVAVLALAVGVGANTAVFRLLNEAFLGRTPHVADPDRLVALGRAATDSPTEFRGFGHVTFQRYRESTHSFRGLAAWRTARVLWDFGGIETRPLEACLVTEDFFSLLGVEIAPGRDFLPEENRTPGTHAVAILSHEVWATHLRGDPGVLGRPIRLNGTQFTVVGFAPPGFRGLEAGDAVDLWLPLMMETEARPWLPVLGSDFFSVLKVVGRLADGVDLRQAEAELAVLAEEIDGPGTPPQPVRVVVSPHVRLPDPGWRAMVAVYLATLQILSGLVFLAACANLASLFLAQAHNRLPEIAIRLALGAGQGRVVREHLGEAMVLAIPAGVAGLLLSDWVSSHFGARVGAEWMGDRDLRVLLFASGATIVAGLGFALAPALYAARRGASLHLRRGLGPGPRPPWHSALLAGQVGVCLALVVGTLVLGQALSRGLGGYGFEIRRVFLAELELERAGFSPPEAEEFYAVLMERVRALPGVESASLAEAPPIDPGMRYGPRDVALAEGEDEGGGRRIQVEFNQVGPGYMETLGIALRRGRGFEAAEHGESGPAAPVALVNETLARRIRPDADALGVRLRLVRFMSLGDPMEIVGVFTDTRTSSRQAGASPQLLVPLPSPPPPDLTVLVRTREGAPEMAGALRNSIRSVGSGLPPVRVESVAERAWRLHSDDLLLAEVGWVAGMLVLFLVLLGLYGTVAFEVARRTREYGLRMAVGATPRQVVRASLRPVMGPAIVGAVMGLACGTGLLHLFTRWDFGTVPADALALPVAAAVVMAPIALASWLPARRASRIDPAEALRHE